MTRLQELKQQYAITQRRLEKLHKDYEGKIKGNIYIKSYTLLVTKMDNIKSQVLLYGTSGYIIMVKGTRNRIGKRNKHLRVIEKFEYYLVNVDPTDVPAILEYKFKNIVEYTTTVIKPGIMIIK